MDDLYKLKCQSLKTLGKCLGISGVSQLNKADLVNVINQRVSQKIDQVGGDTCIYPCPDSPDGRHKFEIRGHGYNSEGEYEDLLECQHCGCKKWGSE